MESLETFGNLGRDNELEDCYFNKTNLWRSLDEMVTCNSVSILFEKMGRKEIGNLKEMMRLVCSKVRPTLAKSLHQRMYCNGI